MDSIVAHTNTSRTASYEAAVLTAMSDLRQLNEEEHRARQQLYELSQRKIELESLIKGLLDRLPPERAAEYKDNLSAGKIDNPTEENRGGEVFNNVVSLVFSKPDQIWGSSEIRREFAKKGTQVDTKAILNVLSYLAKKGSLERVSRGRYFVKGSGVLFEIGHDL